MVIPAPRTVAMVNWGVSSSIMDSRATTEMPAPWEMPVAMVLVPEEVPKLAMTGTLAPRIPAMRAQGVSSITTAVPAMMEMPAPSMTVARMGLAWEVAPRGAMTATLAPMTVAVPTPGACSLPTPSPAMMEMPVPLAMDVPGALVWEAQQRNAMTEINAPMIPVKPALVACSATIPKPAVMGIFVP